MRHHLRHWGKPGAPLLLMLHGWMDVSASFQFLVDAMPDRWHVVAPDWRGFGLTAHATQDNYAFFDYLADLDALIDHLAPPGPIAAIGHSMGGNALMLYAGIRAERFSGVVDVEGFGVPQAPAAEVPGRYRRWLDELHETPATTRFADLDAVIARLRRNAPGLSAERAAFLAPHWARQEGDAWLLRGDPRHKRLNPVPYRLDEAMACWRAVSAPVLWVEAADSEVRRRMAALPDYAERLAAVPHLTRVEIAAAGHNLHHEQPEALAAAIGEFLPS